MTVSSSTQQLAPNDEALEFLEGLFGGEALQLVAMRPDEKPVFKTFGANDLVRAGRWMDAHRDEANMYYHVNPLSVGVKDRKAKKEDVVSARFLHVDIDHLDAEAALASFPIAPTAGVFSGGGYQALFKLRQPIKPDEAERLNVAIAAQLRGDKCHNADRMLRLPGTLNFPDARKRARGRTVAATRIVRELTDFSREYDPSDFEQFAVRTAPLTFLSEVQVRPMTLDELPAGLPPFTRTLIEVGDDPDRPIGSDGGRFPSRSEAVFRATCDMVKAACNPELIVSVLVCAEFGISRSVREKRDPKSYALRQVRAAMAAIENGWPDVDRSGNPRPTFRNTLVALPRLGLKFEYDEFHRRKVIGGRQLEEFVGEVTDDACAFARTLVISSFGFDPGRENVRDAINSLCLERMYHPVRDYLARLEWDGVPRLVNWLSVYLGAEHTPYTEAVGSIVLIAAVRRIRKPGAKFDTVLVLEGPQGTGKSTAIQVLAGPDNFSDQDILALDPKAQIEALDGAWLYEMCELSGISRADTNKVKAFVSRSTDRGRPAYGRFKENRPRQSIFIGTSNDDQYLRDATGNRRFWPVRTSEIDLDGLRRDRDELWAEASLREREGASLILPPELWGSARKEQDQRLERDPWLDMLADVRGARVGDYDRVSSKELLAGSLMIPPDRQHAHQLKRLANVMQQLGWDGPKPLKMPGGSTVRGYERRHDPTRHATNSPAQKF